MTIIAQPEQVRTERHLPFPTPSHRIPPLENGDRLTRAGFERRYQAMHD